jgi:hypothetical protein
MCGKGLSHEGLDQGYRRAVGRIAALAERRGRRVDAQTSRARLFIWTVDPDGGHGALCRWNQALVAPVSGLI